MAAVYYSNLRLARDWHVSQALVLEGTQDSVVAISSNSNLSAVCCLHAKLVPLSRSTVEAMSHSCDSHMITAG